MTHTHTHKLHSLTKIVNIHTYAHTTETHAHTTQTHAHITQVHAHTTQAHNTLIALWRKIDRVTLEGFAKMRRIEYV